LTELKTNSFPGLSQYTVIFSGNSLYTIAVIFLDIANIFQVWSTLKLVIKNLPWDMSQPEIENCQKILFLKNINKTNSLFSVSSLSW